MDGKKDSGNSVLSARLDNDDDDSFFSSALINTVSVSILFEHTSILKRINVSFIANLKKKCIWDQLVFEVAVLA